MSTYEDALRLVIAAYAPHDPAELDDICHDFLAALPPSIVVDGRVVGLEEALKAMTNGPSEANHAWVRGMVDGLLDAARQVSD